MRRIPKSNSIIDYTHGDGFKHVMPGMLEDTDVLVCRSLRQVQHYGHTRATVITLFSLHKLKNPERFKRVIIDTQLPRSKTRAIKMLRELVKGKSVCFVQQLHDYTAVCCALYLLDATEKRSLRVTTWNKYQHFHNYY